MNISDTAKQEVADLIALGQQIVGAASRSGSSMSPEEMAKSTTWVTRTGELLQRLYKSGSHHRRMFDMVVENHDFTIMHSQYHHHGSQVLGILQSVQHELDNGLIADFAKLIEASVFADFLEMAEYLLQEGYKDAAAVLIGGVLEDTLRKLADSNGIPTTRANGNPLTIDPLNAALAKADAYNKLVQKQITSWANLRNDAAHGNYEAYTRDQVQMMLLFVQSFAAEHMR